MFQVSLSVSRRKPSRFCHRSTAGPPKKSRHQSKNSLKSEMVLTSHQHAVPRLSVARSGRVIGHPGKISGNTPLVLKKAPLAFFRPSVLPGPAMFFCAVGAAFWRRCPLKEDPGFRRRKNHCGAGHDGRGKSSRWFFFIEQGSIIRQNTHRSVL